MWKVRFHLGKGEYYRHWQVSNGKGEVLYFDPKRYIIELKNCKLISNLRVALKVKQSGKKDVCGWIKCGSWSAANIGSNNWLREVLEKEYPLDKLCRVLYNPIIDTDWHLENSPSSITNQEFHQLVTIGNRVYCQKLEHKE